VFASFNLFLSVVSFVHLFFLLSVVNILHCSSNLQKQSEMEKVYHTPKGLNLPL